MSIGLEQVQIGIAEAFWANYPTGWNQSVWPAIAENQNWTQPGQAWVRFSVRVSTVRDTSADAKARRISGMVWLQIFLPENTGSLPAQKMGDQMERIYGRKTITAGGEVIRFQRAETGYVGKIDGWEQHRCTVAFISDAVTP